MTSAPKVPDDRVLLRLRDVVISFEQMAAVCHAFGYVETTPGALRSYFSHRQWNPPRSRTTRDIPWRVKETHQDHYNMRMLRVASREAAGEPLPPDYAKRLALWKQRLDEVDAVIDYRPDRGFFWVQRRPGIDLWYVREPDAPRRRAP